jgi:hypothetical protein
MALLPRPTTPTAKFIDGNDTKTQVGFSQWPKDLNIQEDTNHKKKKRKSG